MKIFATLLAMALALLGTSMSSKKNSKMPAASNVWIGKPNGAKSCDPKSGVSLDAGAEELGKSGVVVIESKLASDGKRHAQMCGMATGGVNSYLISQGDLPKAVAQGFQPLEQQPEASH